MMAVALLCSRYQRHRTRLIKGFVLLYILFNTQVAFPRVLMRMADGPRRHDALRAALHQCAAAAHLMPDHHGERGQPA